MHVMPLRRLKHVQFVSGKPGEQMPLQLSLESVLGPVLEPRSVTAHKLAALPLLQ